MNQQSKARTWRLPLSTLVVNSDHKSDIENLTEVIEKSAYDKAVEALKGIRQDIKFDRLEDVIVTKIDETLRDLGVESEA